ncbi:MAG TPA: PAC2 family protein [Acidimicrobiales bacterium]|jgi:predicted ATP-grasp superfamily ATP-dependent carboligase|nr:PAC2 family protein [Acidimicrobiales bacterium]
MVNGPEELIQFDGWPDQLRRPVLVVGLEGWIDAGLGAGAAMATLLEETKTEVFATFDSDALIDQRARRPVLRVVNGINTNLTWPEITLRRGESAERSIIILSGPEPDIRWKQFTREVVSVSTRLGVELMVGLGAFPAPVPHTRSITLVATATTQDLAEEVGYLPATIDVPAGIQASLERGFAEASIPAVGMWARVPHYAAGMPYPAASEALLQKLTELTGIDIDTNSLHEAAATAMGQLDRLISGSSEHSAMVRQLEQQHDDESHTQTAFDLRNLPSGDEIAAELERFLRGDE